jgi:hypothetical protein
VASRSRCCMRQRSATQRSFSTDISISALDCTCIRQHTSAYVSIRQHTSESISMSARSTALQRGAAATSPPTSTPALSIRQHTPAYTSAYVSIRQHTSAYLNAALQRRVLPSQLPHHFVSSCRQTYSIRQHTSAYASIRQHKSAYVSKLQHMPASVALAYISIRQHTAASFAAGDTPPSSGRSASTPLLLPAPHATAPPARRPDTPCDVRVPPASSSQGLPEVNVNPRTIDSLSPPVPHMSLPRRSASAPPPPPLPPAALERSSDADIWSEVWPRVGCKSSGESQSESGLSPCLSQSERVASA